MRELSGCYKMVGSSPSTPSAAGSDNLITAALAQQRGITLAKPREVGVCYSLRSLLIELITACHPTAGIEVTCERIENVPHFLITMALRTVSHETDRHVIIVPDFDAQTICAHQFAVIIGESKPEEAPEQKSVAVASFCGHPVFGDRVLSELAPNRYTRIKDQQDPVPLMTLSFASPGQIRNGVQRFIASTTGHFLKFPQQISYVAQSCGAAISANLAGMCLPRGASPAPTLRPQSLHVSR